MKIQSSSIHARAWSGTTREDLVERAERLETALRSRHDAEGLRELERLRYQARQGLSAASDGTANLSLGAAALGGAVAGGLALGPLGAVGGLLVGLFGGGHLVSVGVKAFKERQLAKFMDARETAGPPVHSPSPRVGEALTATEVERASRARHPVTAGMDLQEAARVLLAPSASGDHRSQLRADMLKARTLWDHAKPGTTACDTLWDGGTGRLYTGVGHVDEWFLTAFDRTGKVAWAATGEPTTSSPVLGPGGSVYFRTRQGLEVRDPDGKRLWGYPAPWNWTDSSPAVAADGTAYLLTGSGATGVREPNQRLVAVKDGTEVWHFDLQGDYTGKPQVLVGPDGTVYVTGRTRTWSWGGDSEDRPSLMAFSPDGALKGRADVSGWPSYVGSSVHQGPDGTLYACHGDQSLTALTPDLEEKWTYRIEDRVVSHGRARLAQAPVADAEGNVYLATETSSDYPEGYLRKLDRQGREVWSLTVDGGLSTRPHLGPDGTLWVGSGRGDLLNVDRDGRHLESVPVGPTSWNNFSFGPDGEIFLNTRTRILSFQPEMPAVDFGASTPGASARPTIQPEGETIVIGGVRLPVQGAA